jgi:hypothetical protein
VTNRGQALQLTAASLTAAAALLAKESAISGFLFLVAILLLKTMVALQPPQVPLSALRRVLVPCVFLLCMAALTAVWRHWMGNWTAPRFSRGDNPAVAAPHLLTRVLTFNHIYSLNLLLLVWPGWLCFDWALGCVPLVSSLLDPRAGSVLLLWTGVLLMICSAVKSAHRAGNYLIVMALMILLLPFLLSMNLFVHVGFVLAERSLYLSTAGMALLVNIGRHRLTKTLSDCCVGPAVIGGLYAVALAAFAARTVLRSRDWRSESALFLSGLAVCPGNAKVHYNLAKVLAANQGAEDLVLLLYKEAVRLGKEQVCFSPLMYDN